MVGQRLADHQLEDQDGGVLEPTAKGDDARGVICHVDPKPNRSPKPNRAVGQEGSQVGGAAILWSGGPGVSVARVDWQNRVH